MDTEYCVLVKSKSVSSFNVTAFITSLSAKNLFFPNRINSEFQTKFLILLLCSCSCMLLF